MCVRFTYSRPPRPRIFQPAVVAIFQAAGVGDAGGVVHIEPVGVIGHTTAAKLQENNSDSNHYITSRQKGQVRDRRWFPLILPLSFFKNTSIWEHHHVQRNSISTEASLKSPPWFTHSNLHLLFTGVSHNAVFSALYTGSVHEPCVLFTTSNRTSLFADRCVMWSYNVICHRHPDQSQHSLAFWLTVTIETSSWLLSGATETHLSYRLEICSLSPCHSLTGVRIELWVGGANCLSPVNHSDTHM